MASLWSGHTEKRAATRETWIYRFIIFAGAILIAPWTPQALGERSIWQVGYYGAYLIVGVMMMGSRANLAWARIHLGRPALVRTAITRKEKHRLVDTGPYGFVRHPVKHGPHHCAAGHRGVTEATPVALLGAGTHCPRPHG